MDGVELLDFSAADREAREMARDLLTGSVVTRPEWAGWRIEVRDENGNQVLSFPALQD